ncbi:MAG TPA: zf-HC2 domain-containing protein [Pyrinomonadaceae bacterium]|nr:zf-HC2 domain-containing protein [Pyrinomonadaceae bacterium]
MTRCLDEATLQCYFDGELSPKLMESATAHLASCAACAGAARELAEEAAFLESALTAELDVAVPTAALRERIDAAVLGERVARAGRVEKPGLFASLASVFSFNSQRTLGYASLVVVLAFGAIFGIVKFRQPEAAPQNTDFQANVPSSPTNSTSNPVKSNPVEVVASAGTQAVVSKPIAVKYTPRPSTPKVIPVEANHVQLLPGERSYLKAIARLDSTIKQNKSSMRPSLQVEYERNLAVVDRAIAATRNAAKSNPNDPDAADFMFAAYQSKVDLLNTIADARLSGGRSH